MSPHPAAKLPPNSVGSVKNTAVANLHAGTDTILCRRLQVIVLLPVILPLTS